jgi:tRNA threonylcarbamoyladenosine biosynthesis protein TsaB
MTILALEFSSEQRSVALARVGEVLASAVETGDPRVTKAFGLIEKVLAQAKVARSEIELIAVGLGPGSYTGIRAAIALAQGWQLARGVKLAGVSSVEAVVARAQAEQIFSRVNVVVDAQREEFYLAEWDISAEKREEISGLRIIPAGELRERIRRGEQCLGPAAEKVLFPDAASVARLAAGQAHLAPGAVLEPIYLRETSFVKVLTGRTK